MSGRARVRSTTVLGVLRGGRLALAADGQVTIGQAVVKHGAQKVRSVAKGRALVGFAGGAADALALLGHTELAPRAIARAAMEIAAQICIYTNAALTIEELP